jgi:hypothetical protein
MAVLPAEALCMHVLDAVNILRKGMTRELEITANSAS